MNDFSNQSDQSQNGSIAIAPKPSVLGQINYRMNFAIQHLMAATYFAKLMCEIENQNLSEPSPFWICSACVFFSVAGVETYANEVFVDGDLMFPNISSETIKESWEKCERQSALNKFDFIYQLREKGSLNRKSPQSENIIALIKLRNGLVHFKPQWDSGDGNHSDISNLLEGKFEPNKWFPGETMFPRAWACYACAQWAVNSAKEFLMMVEEEAKLPSKLEQFVNEIHS